MYKHSDYALLEEREFLRFLETEAWPTKVNALRHHMPHTPTKDDELSENSGNDTCILQSLLDGFQRHHPMKETGLVEQSRVQWTGTSRSPHAPVHSGV